MLRNLGGFEGSLFDEFRRFERQMDQVFGAGSWPHGIRAVERGTFPPINIGSTPDRVDVFLFAAGVNPESFDISIQQNLLTVEGERRLSTEDGADYYRKERFNGGFHRVITLPEDVDPEKVNASYRDGVLHVTVQRRVSAKPRQIEVK